MGFPVFGQIFGSRFGRNMGQGGGTKDTRWSLLDTFSTSRAGGSVNGTPADGTGQTRTVTDTNNKLSTNGAADFATGGVSAGDPGLWYPQQTRVLGKALLGTIFTTSQALEMGWDNSQVAGGILDCLRISGTTTLGVRDNNTVITVDITTIAFSGLNIQVALITRAAGSWFFIKGNVYTFWTLAWISLGSSGNLFPACVATTATNVSTADNIRIPFAIYIPLPLAYDTFTRANGALGSTETTGPDAQSITALVWNFTVGKWAIVTNKAVGTPTQGVDLVVNGTFSADTDWTKGAGWTIAAGLATAALASSNLTAAVAPLTTGVWYQTVYDLSAFAAGTVRIRVGGTNMPTHAANATYTETNRAAGTSLVFVGAGFTGSLDNVTCKALTLADLFSTILVSSADVLYEIGITLPSATGGVQGGIVCNLDNTVTPANFIIVYLDGAGNVIVDECVAGAYANKLAATAITYSAGALLRIIRDGTSLRVFYNNAAVGGVITMTANVNKNVGNFSTSPLVSFDNVACWARGTSGEYEAALNAFNYP